MGGYRLHSFEFLEVRVVGSGVSTRSTHRGVGIRTAPKSNPLQSCQSYPKDVLLICRKHTCSGLLVRDSSLQRTFVKSLFTVPSMLVVSRSLSRCPRVEELPSRHQNGRNLTNITASGLQTEPVTDFLKSKGWIFHEFPLHVRMEFC